MNGGSEAIFVPGKLSPDGTKFVKAESACDLAMRRIAAEDGGTATTPPPFDANSLSIVFKKRRPTNGYMVKRKGKLANLINSNRIFLIQLVKNLNQNPSLLDSCTSKWLKRKVTQVPGRAVTWSWRRGF